MRCWDLEAMDRKLCQTLASLAGGFNCCPYYRGVCNKEVSRMRELNVLFVQRVNRD